MIRCEVIKDFTLEKFGELEDIERKKLSTKGKLYVGDTFKCTKEMADYLMGKNSKGNVVVKVIEVIPEKKAVIKTDNVTKEIVNESIIEQPKKSKKKKSKK